MANYELNLSNRCYTSDHIRLIQKEIDNYFETHNLSSKEIVKIDLSQNYLNSNCVQFIVNILKQYDNIIVDLSVNNIGFSDFMNYDVGHLSFFHQGRLIVATSLYHKQVEELLVAHKKTEEALQKTQKDIADFVESLKYLKPSLAAIKNMNSYIDTDARIVEEAVAVAVASRLDNPSILHHTRYSFASSSGDVDAIVIGRYNNQDIIVFCASKYNIDSSIRKAQSELFQTLKYWEFLKQLDPNNIDQEYAEDYRNLYISETLHRIPYFAFGGCIFSETSIAKFKLKTPWFRVIINQNGRFEAHFHDSA